MNLEIAILEDNKAHYEELSSLIESWGIRNGHLIHIHWFLNDSDILTSESLFNCHLLFSDIELKNDIPPMLLQNDVSHNHTSNGIDVCMELRKKGFKGDIIFLTAFREYVFDGYEVNAMNYLLKPISETALMKCLDKFISLHFSDYYYYHKGNEIIQIPYNHIICITRVGHDCYIQTLTDLYLERGSLKDFEKRLPKQFIRCHKSCIVNINHIKSLSGNTIKLSNKQSHSVGRLFLDNIRKALIELSNELNI